MNTAICTLFEGHYHHGVAALSNSLYNNGFRGSIYVGYRGELPSWASTSIVNHNLEYQDGRTLKIFEGLKLHFLPINTNYHLANYKPFFMLELWSGPAKNADKMFYFDPDIVIKSQWEYFDKWVDYGVALVHEITSNDMPPSHPLRKNWEEVIRKCNKKNVRSINSYINSGFCGLKRKDISFLKDWVCITETAITNFEFNSQQFQHSKNRGFMFFAQDQDAFNITAMCSESPISEMGPEAMDFIHGGFTMSHAIGGPKPWRKNFILSALKGIPPSIADKTFWLNVGLPISTFNYGTKIYIKYAIKVASFMGRFYRKY
jgi:hypothetical protein